ncbi:MAG TPA: hypothetical protein VGR33_05020 [Actinomycetota bacterium]|nr:hypothetical protein [Actinomycetota bacterium]
MRLIAESEIRSEPGQVRICCGEPLQGLLHPNLATVPRQRHAGDVAEGTAEVERRDSYHTGKLDQSKVGPVGKKLSDLVGDRSSAGSVRRPAQPHRLSCERREEATGKDDSSFEELECIRAPTSSGKEYSVLEIETGPNDEMIGKAVGRVRQFAERGDRGLDDGARIAATGMGDLLHRPGPLHIADHRVNHQFGTVDPTSEESRPNQDDGQVGDRLLRRPFL